MKVHTQLTNNENRKRTNMKLQSIAGIVFALMLVVASSAYAKQSAGVLFQSGLYQEQVKGDLDAAIKVYERIIINFPRNRPVAAKALLHIGLCYEKLGKQEAQKAYRRLIQEYADQHEPVAQARARLAALGQALGAAGDAQRTGLVVQEVKIKPGEMGLSLSRDGNRLVYPKRKDGKTNLVVRNLVSGEETQITNYETGMARYPLFSPDGKKVAYSRFLDMRNQKLHIVSLETGEDRDLDQYGFPQDWSRDGRFILIHPIPWAEDEAKTKTLNVLPVGGGSVKKLKVPGGWSSARFSPDTEYVSYSHQGKLHLYPVDGGDPIQITDGSTRDSEPIWSPDGKMLLFLSARAFGPEKDICGVSIVDGKAAGNIEIIKPDFGDGVSLISLSETGRLLYRRRHTENYIYSTAVDPQTGQPTGEPVKLASGYVSMLSPDGKRIAYISKKVLHVMSADGSNDQEIIRVHPFIGTHTWAPDNEHIYVADMVTGAGIYSISVSTKERRPVFLDRDMMGHVTCSPDGKRLAFLKLPAASEKDGIFTVNVDGTNLRQLTFDDAADVYYPAWSPDGKHIAFCSSPKKGGTKTLTVVSVDDGTTREVFRGETPKDWFLEASWSPDGSKIAWSGSGEIRIGQVSDGKYQTFKVDLERKPGLGMPHWSADGTKMVFSAGSSARSLMIMDNFLPESAAGR